MTSETDKHLSAEQVSEYCGVSVATVERWIGRGGTGVRNNKVALEDFISFLDENKRQAKESSQDILKVLIIDDEPNVVDCIGGIFSTHGFNVITTPDAIEAGNLINIERPQIVTLDLALNIFDGLDVLKIIDGLRLSGKIWIIVISGDSEKNLQNAVTLGADCYLQKPFSSDDLNKIINKFFPGQKVG